MIDVNVGEQAYHTELGIVMARLEWLAAVLDGPESALDTLNDKLNKDSQQMSDAASSRDGGSVGRAGPCAGFSDLKPISVLVEHAVKFRVCVSDQSVQDVKAEVKPLKNLLRVLNTSCQGSVTGIRGVRQKAINKQETARLNLEKAKQGTGQKKRAAEATKGRQPKKLASSIHPAFTIEPPGGRDQFIVPSVPYWSAGMQTSTPFIISAVEMPKESVADSSLVTEALGSFKKVFAESAMRTTDGRGQHPFAQWGLPTANAAVANMVEALGGGDEARKEDMRKAFFFDMGRMAKPEDHPSLTKHLRPMLFGIAGCNVSLPNFELNMMGCIRICVEGTRQVALFNVSEVLKVIGAEKSLLDCQAWCASITGASLIQFGAQSPGAFYLATVGPNDLLFTPANFLTAHRVTNVGDVVGARFAYYSRLEKDIYESFPNNQVMRECLKAMEEVEAVETEPVRGGEQSSEGAGGARREAAMAAAAAIDGLIAGGSSTVAASGDGHGQLLGMGAEAAADPAAEPARAEFLAGGPAQQTDVELHQVDMNAGKEAAAATPAEAPSAAAAAEAAPSAVTGSASESQAVQEVETPGGQQRVAKPSFPSNFRG